MGKYDPRPSTKKSKRHTPTKWKGSDREYRILGAVLDLGIPTNEKQVKRINNEIAQRIAQTWREDI